jgi:hypothetical protein
LRIRPAEVRPDVALRVGVADGHGCRGFGEYENQAALSDVVD